MKIKKAILLLTVPLILSCKSDFLDAVSDKSKVVPESLEDMEAILNNTTVMNLSSAHLLALIGVDEYELTDARWSLIPSELERSAYIWQGRDREELQDWNYSYKRILYSNLVLEGLEKMEFQKSGPQADYINGAALFYRAISLFDMVPLFCKAYDPQTADDDLGLPLKTTSAIEDVPQRASLGETLTFILDDLMVAGELLPDDAGIAEKPNKMAVMALLSRIYLYMADYEDALFYAEQVLKNRDELLDYKTIPLDAPYPFPRRGTGNPEVIFMYMTGGPSVLSVNNFDVSKKFYGYFSDDDLRKRAFFLNNQDGRILFKGMYSGQNTRFTGLSTDEVYLIAAECAVRMGELDKGLSFLNRLSKKRYVEYQDVSLADFDNETELLAHILLERKKELYQRGLYWADLKRLNIEGRFVEKLQRTINGETYELLPNSPNYVWPIPYQAVELSGLEQN